MHFNLVKAYGKCSVVRTRQCNCHQLNRKKKRKKITKNEGKAQQATAERKCKKLADTIKSRARDKKSYLRSAHCVAGLLPFLAKHFIQSKISRQSQTHAIRATITMGTFLIVFARVSLPILSHENANSDKLFSSSFVLG